MIQGTLKEGTLLILTVAEPFLFYNRLFVAGLDEFPVPVLLLFVIKLGLSGLRVAVLRFSGPARRGDERKPAFYEPFLEVMVCACYTLS